MRESVCHFTETKLFLKISHIFGCFMKKATIMDQNIMHDPLISYCRPKISPIKHSTRVSDSKQIKISSADYSHVTLSE